jgi:hypothetical protein
MELTFEEVEMKKFLSNDLVVNKRKANFSLTGIKWGSLGGFAGTLIMDLFLIGAFSAFGLPTLSCFSMIGEIVTKLFFNQCLVTINSVYIGIIVHYIVGPLIGLFFGIIITRLSFQQVLTQKRIIIYAILWVELISQPLLLTAPILLNMTKADIFAWYVGSTMMHFIAALVLGFMVNHGLRSSFVGNQKTL